MEITIDKKWQEVLKLTTEINQLKKRVEEINKRMDQIEGKEIEKEWLKKNCKQA